MDEAGWGLGISQWEGVILGENMGRPIVTSGGLFTVGNSHIAVQRGCCLANSWNCGQARHVGIACRLGMASMPSSTALLSCDHGQTCY